MSATVSVQQIIINAQTIIRITTTEEKREIVGVTDVKSTTEPLTEFKIHCLYDHDVVCMAEHFNSLLKDVPLGKKCLPLTEVSVFYRMYDGILLCALANLIKPDAVDEKSITVKSELLDNSPEGEIRKKENRNIGITALRSFGVCVTKNTADSIDLSTPLSMMPILVQLFRRVTIGQMHFQNFDVLVNLFDGWSSLEEASAILATDREKILLIWINAQLKIAKKDLQLIAFGVNLADSEVYSILLWTVAPEAKRASLTSPEDVMKQTDLTKRAELVIANAEKLGISGILRPEHIVKAWKLGLVRTQGLLNIVLNMAFLYRIFLAYPNIDVSKTKDKPAPAAAAASKTAAATPAKQISELCKFGTTEETLIRWLNSFGPSSPVVSLKTDLCNGKVLLEVWDAMFPDSVNWKRVKLDNLNDFAKRKFNWMANCDMAISIGEKHGISRNVCSSGNITAGETKYIASMVFMMMRLHAQLTRKDIIGGSATVPDLDDKGLLKWFNESMEKYKCDFRLKTLDDPSLKNTNALGFFGERVLVENNLLISGPADFPRKPAGAGAPAGKKVPPPVAPKPKMPAKSRNATDANQDDAAEEGGEETETGLDADESQLPQDAHNSGGGTWLFKSIEQVASDPIQLMKFSVTAILMFNKAGVIVYASKLGPETDSVVYRSILLELNALSLNTK